ncbi:HTH-type transcriptional regulator LeuO [Sulfitobacter sp. THAF37]|uniref:LysR family transcriptional regulator n=1 Tax=Sulfitobacter sp. THAF37 TaxID=2587855 RepID=UPI0012687EA2|nr:LysR family transcriptional regulator [Sulfitobacter sp. THAF37]QFT58323.1 HTH-type transcriptional regulator LeuO [Sulfitobacter sp. THAF37]
MNFSSFDLNLLRVLDALLDTRSTTRAGQRIGLSQPAVSAALSRLRLALNDPLLVRVGPRLEPTDYALSLADPLRKVLEQTEAVLSGPPLFDPAVAEDRFCLSGSDFFAEMLMPALAEKLGQDAPGVRIQLVDLVPDNFAGALERQDVDLAMVPEMKGPSWMEWQPMFRARFAMIARRGHPRLAALPTPGEIDLDTFCDLGHILFSPEGNLQAMSDAALAAVGRERRVVMTLPVMYGVCSAVAETDYVAIVPDQLAQKIVTKLNLQILTPPLAMPGPMIGMIWHRRRTNAAAHRWIRGVIADLMAPLDHETPPPAQPPFP